MMIGAMRLRNWSIVLCRWITRDSMKRVKREDLWKMLSFLWSWCDLIPRYTITQCSCLSVVMQKISMVSGSFIPLDCTWIRRPSWGHFDIRICSTRFSFSGGRWILCNGEGILTWNILFNRSIAGACFIRKQWFESGLHVLHDAYLCMLESWKSGPSLSGVNRRTFSVGLLTLKYKKKVTFLKRLLKNFSENGHKKSSLT